ncbi:erythromycin esterase family protein [Novosphingobium sp. RD2P27]|uniref:Erythromycin esterase family protein n=1 Tax=Novosphingobium kalidii TaxID=3230299 RepID=A0ABV2D482_9SPHN
MNDVQATAALIAAAAESLPDIDDPAFAHAFDRLGDARIVCLGEASHGTSEFYLARAAITQRLIERHGFTIVAVEADWPDAASIDRHVRHKPPAVLPEPAFSRFPTWMWRNEEVAGFVEWMRGFNAGREPDTRAGFYGLDLYNLGGSMRAVIDYLDRVDPEAAAVARERYGCLRPWQSEPADYGRVALVEGYARCEQAVVAQLKDMFAKVRESAGSDGDDFLDAAQNARLVANAEAYYRAMYYGAAESWNLRDTHMFETLDALLKAKGPDTKAVVWAHNSHLGDARHTAMGRERDELNLGQLCREYYGDAVRLVGFGTHCGTVAAATDWDGPMEVKPVNPSRPDSYEYLCHASGVARFLLDLRDEVNAQTIDALEEERLERFIGVIYRPKTERWNHYSEAVLPKQFDAWVWFDETQAVRPLPGPNSPGADDTYPFGL